MPVKKAAQAQPNVMLRRARLERGWSQQEVADLVGAPQAFMVNRWENGTTFPGPGYRKKLCELFGKSREELGLVKAIPQVGGSNKLQERTIDPMLPLQGMGIEHLVGREETLLQLKQQLGQVSERTQIALYGLPGVGKTTLAVRLAMDEQVRAAFQGGILWARLGPRPNLSSLLSRWASLLGVSREEEEMQGSADSWMWLLRQAIGMKRMLIIIDDAWNIEEALSCLVGGPGCSYVLTTRIPEVAMHFAGAQAVQISELNRDEGVDLLLNQVPVLREIEEEDLHSLVDAVGGLPLALRLMGTYLLMQTRTQQKRRLREALARLQKAEERLRLEQPQAGPDRDPRLPDGVPLTLQAMIGLSEALLNDEERRALAALSVFPSRPESFSEEAALWVAEIQVQVLDRLVDVGLVESDGQERYLLHQTIADYARTQRKGNEAEQRLVDYVVNYVEWYHEEHEILEEEHGMIFAALDAARRVERKAEFVRLVCLLVPFLRRRGLFPTLERYLHQAYQLARQDHLHLMIIVDYLSEILRQKGEYEAAEIHCREGLELALKEQSQPRYADLLARLGIILMERGEFKKAKENFQQALQIAQQIDYTYRMAGCYSCLAEFLTIEGDFVQAEKLIQEALELSRQHNYQDQVLSQICKLGWIQKNLSKLKQAEDLLLEGLEQAEKLGSRAYTAIMFTNLGWIRIEQEDFARARYYLEQGVEHARSVGQTSQEVECLALMGVIEIKLIRPKQAKEVLLKGLKVARAGCRPEKLSLLLLVLGLVEARLFNYEIAEAHLQEGLELTKRLGHHMYYSGVKLALSSVYMQQGRKEDALRMLQEGLALARRIGTPWAVGNGVVLLGRWYLEHADYDTAETYFQELFTIIPTSYRRLMANGHEGLARIAMGRGKREEANEEANKALAILAEIGSPQEQIVRKWLEGQKRPH